MKYLAAALIAFAIAAPASAQTVYMQQRAGTVVTPKTYATPLRNLFFGTQRYAPIYQYKPYRVVTPPPVYYQPPAQVYQRPSYLVPMGK